MVELADLQGLSLYDLVILSFGNPWILPFVAVALFVVIRFLRKRPDWRGLAQNLKSRPWSVHDAVLLIVVPLALSLIARVLVVPALTYFKVVKGGISDSGVFVLHTLSFHVPLVIAVWMLVRGRGLSMSEAFGMDFRRFKRDVVRGLVAYAAAIPLINITAALADYCLYKACYVPESQLPIHLLAVSGPLWIKLYVVITVVLVVPLAEELFFRGIAFPAVGRSCGLLFSMIALSLLFSFSHQNIFLIAPLFTMGVALCVGYLRTGSIIVPLTMHAAFNAVNVCFTLLPAVLRI